MEKKVKSIVALTILLASTISFAQSREISTQDLFKEVASILDSKNQTGAYEGVMHVLGGSCLTSVSGNKEKSIVILTTETKDVSFSVYFPSESKIIVENKKNGDIVYSNSEGSQVVVHFSQSEPAVSIGDQNMMLMCLRGMKN